MLPKIAYTPTAEEFVPETKVGKRTPASGRGLLPSAVQSEQLPPSKEVTRLSSKQGTLFNIIALTQQPEQTT